MLPFYEHFTVSQPRWRIQPSPRNYQGAAARYGCNLFRKVVSIISFLAFSCFNIQVNILLNAYTTFSCSAQVFEGHPFIVETGVSVGGKDVKQVSSFLFTVGIPLFMRHCINHLRPEYQTFIKINLNASNQIQSKDDLIKRGQNTKDE